MDRVRDEFSVAVHDTLAALPAAPASAPRANKTTARACPPDVADAYARAREAGGRFLTLGSRLQARYRQIRRGEDGGDAVGLTPDYRWKVRRAREQFSHLLVDYREMSVAFHDQLGAEMRHLGCKVGPSAARKPAPPATVATDDAAATPALDPADPGAWAVEADDDPALDATRPPPPVSVRVLAAAPAPAVAPAGAATPIWIDVDNALCAQPTHVTIDGQAMGDVAGRSTASIRTRAGPHEVCVLPAADQRPCGAPGTVRKAYLHEGWSLTVHCGK